jgi:hypothetical protein
MLVAEGGEIVGKKSLSLCKWKKDDLADPDKMRRVVKDPRFTCKDCGRAASRKKWLCKPQPLDGKA